MKCILVICPSINSYQVISTSQPTQLLFLSKQTNKNKKNIQNMPTKRKIKITSQKPSNIKNGQINKMRSNVYKSLLSSFVSSSLSWAWACSGVQLIYSVKYYARKIFFPMPADISCRYFLGQRWELASTVPSQCWIPSVLNLCKS